MKLLKLSVYCLIFCCSCLHGQYQEVVLDFKDLPGWETADIRSSVDHFLSLEKSGRLLDRDSQLIARLKSINPSNNKALKQAIETYFKPIKRTHNKFPTRLTGYHIYTTTASTVQTPEFPVPIYKHPQTIQHSSDFTAEAIMKGALKSLNLELAWLPSYLDVYLLMMQGSGCLIFPDGSKQAVVYAGSNGHSYRSISDYMIKQGYITEATRTGPNVKLFIQQNPTLAPTILTQNPSYVFFKFKPDFAYMGAANTPLKETVSIAIDPNYYSFNSLMWLSTTLPYQTTQNSNQLKPFHQLVVTQDTGGAIKGPQRADLYFGLMSNAETLAGLVNDPHASLIYFIKK